jgi:two-component system CheB/CheR fusion protein
MHELATNAAKYGALSVPSGKIRLSWDLDGSSTAPTTLRVCWKEKNGPPVHKPERTGFGHVVMERLVSQALSGKVQLEFAPDGLVWSLEVPAEAALWHASGASEVVRPRSSTA